jgi:hypothetical protein
VTLLFFLGGFRDHKESQEIQKIHARKARTFVVIIVPGNDTIKFVFFCGAVLYGVLKIFSTEKRALLMVCPRTGTIVKTVVRISAAL